MLRNDLAIGSNRAPRIPSVLSVLRDCIWLFHHPTFPRLPLPTKKISAYIMQDLRQHAVLAGKS